MFAFLLVKVIQHGTPVVSRRHVGVELVLKVNVQQPLADPFLCHNVFCAIPAQQNAFDPFVRLTFALEPALDLIKSGRHCTVDAIVANLQMDMLVSEIPDATNRLEDLLKVGGPTGAEGKAYIEMPGRRVGPHRDHGCHNHQLVLSEQV